MLDSDRQALNVEPHQAHHDESDADDVERLGVHAGTLANRVKQGKINCGEAEGLSGGDRAELARLCAENAELWMERDVLKRSVVLWVKEARR
ncbi:hypothetical protein GCM10022222_61850 [Amycolatopsis ultiminotia]|uniref:DNA-binding protein n=1 Tax=Amycolatopsis ultiminotia TaxID=543629 RepID=A0ABP6XLW3_9PSEU